MNPLHEVMMDCLEEMDEELLQETIEFRGKETNNSLHQKLKGRTVSWMVGALALGLLIIIGIEQIPMELIKDTNKLAKEDASYSMQEETVASQTQISEKEGRKMLEEANPESIQTDDQVIESKKMTAPAQASQVKPTSLAEILQYEKEDHPLSSQAKVRLTLEEEQFIYQQVALEKKGQDLLSASIATVVWQDDNRQETWYKITNQEDRSYLISVDKNDNYYLWKQQ